MDLRKLPPSVVLALGLVACGDDGSQESEAGPCLSIDPTEVGSTSNTSNTSTSGTGSTGSTGSTGEGTSSTGVADVSTGPCLSPPESTTSTATGSDSGSDSDTGGIKFDLGAPTRNDATRRVLERGTLPADVAERLRRRLDEDH
ncbi:MAG: hypothetical protein KDK70_20475 [Myxococcales bacterium]|nr:hypothetical protein [Myxococcales bacterium]